jgi:two-component sensor histidine kinase
VIKFCKYILILLIGIFDVTIYHAQIIDHFTTENVLPTNTVYGLFKLKSGLIICCTDKGLLSYDGISFRAFTCLNPQDEIKDEIFDIYEDQQDRIWLSSFKANLSFIYNRRFHSAANDSSLKRKLELISVSRTIENSKGQLLIYSQGLSKVYTYDGRNLQDYKTLKKVHDYYTFDSRPDGSLVFYGYNGMAEYSGKSIYDTTYDIPYDYTLCKHMECHSYRATERILYLDSFEIDQSIQPVAKKCINSIITDDNTGLWYISHHNGLLIYDTRKRQVKTRLFGNIKVTDVLILQNNRLLVATHNNGIYLVDFVTKEFKRQGNDTATYSTLGVTDQAVVAITQDKCIDVLDKNLKLLATRQLPLTANVNAFYLKQQASDIHELYSAAEHIKIDALGNMLEVSKSHVANPKKVIKFQNDILALCAYDLVSVNKNKYLARTGRERIFDMLNYRDSVVVLTAQSATFLYDPNHGLINVTKQVSPIFKLYKTKLHTLVLTHKGELFETSDILNKQLYRKIELSNSSEVVDNIYIVNDSVILVTTPDGAVALADKQGGYKINWLSNDIIGKHIIGVQSQGPYLFITNRYNIQRKPYDLLFSKNTLPSIVNITVSTKDSSYSNAGTVKLSAADGSINLDFFILNIDKVPVQLRYKIDNSAWFVSKSVQIPITKIPYGASKVVMQLCYPDGTVIQESIIKLHRATPFYKSNLALLLACIAGMLAIILVTRAIYKSRNQKKLKLQEDKYLSLKNELKSLNALMNPHFVFNSLANIQAMYAVGKSAHADQYVKQFSNLIRKNMRNVQLDLISVSDEMDLVSDYVKLENMRFQNAIEWQVNISNDVDADSLMIPPLMLQPLVENAIKHGLFRKQNKANRLQADIYKSGKIVVIDIKDNGIGIQHHSDNSQEQLGNKLALKNIQQRLHHLSLLTNANATMCDLQEGDWHVVRIEIG